MIEGLYVYTMWFVIQIIYVSVASRENLSKFKEEGYNRFPHLTCWPGKRHIQASQEVSPLYSQLEYVAPITDPYT